MKTKKQMVWLLCGLVALTTGCRQNELDIPGGKVLKAVIEGGETRTSFDSYEGKFAWTADDKLAVFYNDGTKSEATVATDGTVEVPASTASRHRSYYAVYPASVVEDITDGSQPLVVTLPNSYDLSGKSEDYSPLPMVALNDEDSDILMFYHVGGLLRITLKGLRAGTEIISVRFDKDVTGTYTVSDPGTDHPTITTPETGDPMHRRVEFTGIPSSDRVVLNIPVPCGTYDRVMVSAESDDYYVSKTYDEKPLVFLRHHGKKLSFSEMNLEFFFGDLCDAEVDYRGGNWPVSDPELGNFYSYKTDGTTEEPVPFTLEYSEDDGSTWTATPPSWVIPGSLDLNGSVAGQQINMAIRSQESPDVHHQELIKDSRARTDFDLSTFDVSTTKWEDNETSTSPKKTANCYVVQGSGTYKFPLVYGNGVDWTKNSTNGDNEGAYHGRAGDGDYRPDEVDSKYLGHFKDHLDQNITSPYIATQLAGKTLTATLIWEDVQGLVTNVGISDSGENAYITFRVPKETITQGNALVAVLADGVIAWSWHIWVTEDDMSDVKMGPGGEYFAPYNVGWCYDKRIYPGRSCMVRATQSGSGETRLATLTQNAGSVLDGGNSPYYQWGRKDPLQALIAGIGLPAQLKLYYPSSETYTPQSGNAPVSIGMAIQNPYKFYKNESSSRPNWCSSPFYNIWNSVVDGYGEPACSTEVTKTIYDPSPVGFKVPSGKALRALANTSFPLISTSLAYSYGRPGHLYQGALFFPNLSYRRGTTSDIGSSISQTGIYWSAVPYESSTDRLLGPYALTWSDGHGSGGYSPMFTSGHPVADAYPMRSVKE